MVAVAASINPIAAILPGQRGGKPIPAIGEFIALAEAEPGTAPARSRRTPSA